MNICLFAKIFIISAIAVCLAMGLKSSVPVAMNQIPMMWSNIQSCLKPPYLYILINAIIITIAMSSRSHDQIQSEPHVQSHRQLAPVIIKTPPPSDLTSSYSVTMSDDLVADQLKPVVLIDSNFDIGEDEEEKEDVLVDSVAEVAITSPEKVEKPVKSGHRKPSRAASQRVKSSRVAKEETLESIWKKITEGVQSSRATHEASPQVLRRACADPSLPLPSSTDAVKGHVLKLKSVNERRTVRREPSMSQEEVNRRVEAFIKKFNDEIRSQRKNSMDKYV